MGPDGLATTHDLRPLSGGSDDHVSDPDTATDTGAGGESEALDCLMYWRVMYTCRRHTNGATALPNSRPGALDCCSRASLRPLHRLDHRLYRRKIYHTGLYKSIYTGQVSITDRANIGRCTYV